jgi:hypothetical protein
MDFLLDLTRTDSSVGFHTIGFTLVSLYIGGTDTIGSVVTVVVKISRSRNSTAIFEKYQLLFLRGSNCFEALKFLDGRFPVIDRK